MKLSRRQLLRGAAGFSLALPFLPSLVHPREASADVPTTKRFIQFCTDHGGIWGSNMYPGDATLTDQMSYAGRIVKRGDLALTTQGTDAMLSPVLRAPGTLLTPRLAAKMNVLRGLDVPFYLGHHTGGHLGNFARNDGNGSDGQLVQSMPTPTIDQRMAWSPSFYGDLSTNRERVMVIGNRISYVWSNPQQKSGTIEEVAGTHDALDLFQRIFAPNDDKTASLPPVVDRVLADYNRLRQSNTRLSSDDRRRLDDHMQRLSELERRLKVHASCKNVTPVTTDTTQLEAQAAFGVDPDLQAKLYETMNDVIVAAILCDTSRIAVIHASNTFSSYTGEWHQEVAHQTGNPDGVKQQVMVDSHRTLFARAFVDLAAKLDVDDGFGRTYLDGSLIAWTQESGEYTHDAQGMPVITAGSAGGFLKTGNYCDYRNTSVVIDDGTVPGTKVTAGLLWHQWLGTALQAMGLSRSEYEQDGVKGYPAVTFVGTFFQGTHPASYFYPSQVFDAAGDILPFLKA